MRLARLLPLVCLAIAAAALEGGSQDLRSAPFDRGNRYEGLVGLPIGGPSRPGLDLLSFTGYFEAFTGNVDLQVRFFLPPWAPQARVVAQELTQDRFYRMESRERRWPSNAWATFGPWPTGEVIIPQNVRPSNIGVVVRLDEAPEGRSLVAPVFVHQSGTAVDFTRYRVQLRPVRATFGAVDHRLERTGTGAVEVIAKQRTTVERPERRPFRIDLGAATLAEGRYRLTVVGHVKNDASIQVTRQYEFEHRRLPK